MRRGEMGKKVEVQFWDERGVLRYVEARLMSTAGGWKVKALGRVLVFKSLVEPCEVVSLEGGRWVKVGRVTRFGEIILGEGMSAEELSEFKSSRERRNIRLCPDCNDEFKSRLEYAMVFEPVRMMDGSLRTTGFLTRKCDVCGREAPCFEYLGARVRQQLIIPKSSIIW